ncbi:putative oxidoreductase C-terminal domain-containing protein [soil metagenome]
MGKFKQTLLEIFSTKSNLTYIAIIVVFQIITSCTPMNEQTGRSEFEGAEDEIRIMTLNPGHFHAALIQKENITQLNDSVFIYAPAGADLDLHLERIESFNNREYNPTHWETEIYTGPDYLEQMLSERPGNVMVTAGNNSQKTMYIKRTVDAGIHVLSDKPMAINSESWQLLADAFESARENDVLLYDIMTERYEVTSQIQRRLAQNSELFGELKLGTPEDPAIIKESVHHLFKTVAGQTLRRPPWYFDVEQQGEGIVDVTTHLVDLSMWGAFPNQIIDYREDVEMLEANRWPVMITQNQFESITGISEFPDYLQDQLDGDILPYYSNGEMIFTIHGHHVNVSVEWEYQAPQGGDDTHYSVQRGTQSDLIIRQGAEQDFKSTLYVEPVNDVDKADLESAFNDAISQLEDEYPGLTYEQTDIGWKLIIPDEYYLGHEAHFSKVAEAYFGYLVDGELPDWEVPNMLTKYYITTQARELARNSETMQN